MSKVVTEVIVEGADKAASELDKVDREFEEMGEGAGSAGDGMEELDDGLGMLLVNAAAIVYVGGVVIDVLKGIYNAAREGAEAIGGETLDAYEEFEQGLQHTKETGQAVITQMLMPFIEWQNRLWESTRALDEALAAGIITQDQYTIARRHGIDAEGDWQALAPEVNAAIRSNADAVDDMTDSVLELTKAEMAHINYQQSSWDKAMLVSAGLIESSVSPALLAMQADAREAQVAWGLLSQQMDGPFGDSAKRFAENQADLVQHIADIKGEIADLGGLEYLTPEQIDQILVLRDKLIGVSMEINDIEDAYGEAFDRGATGRKVLEAADTLEDLRQTAWELEQQIIALGSKPYVTADNLERIGELQTELGETEQAIDDLADAQEEATRRMVLSMLQQALALDGLTLEEVGKLNDLALAWGLIDQATYDAQQTALEAADLINNDADFNEWIAKLNEIEGVHFVDIVVTVTGAELLAAAADDLAAMQDAHQGGYIDPTQPYGPGNSGASGGVDPVDGGENSGGGSSGNDMPSGGDMPSININVDGETIARITGEQLGALVRQARAAGSGRAGV